MSFELKISWKTSISEADLFKYNSWIINPDWSPWIISTWIVTYFMSIIPSYLAIPFIFATRSIGSIALFVDGYLKISTMLFRSSSTDPVWNVENWYKYSFLRWIFDNLISWCYFITQPIPILNWLLNLIPIYIAWANITTL